MSLKVNKSQKTHELQGHKTVLDGNLILGPIHGCFSSLHLNGKELIIPADHSAKGDSYSLDGCPK